VVDLRIPPEDEQAALDALRDAGVRLVAVDAIHRPAGSKSRSS
jgi:hypothetical protein